MINLLSINTTFRAEKYYSRWRLLTREYPDVNVTLIGPRFWKNSEWGKDLVTKAVDIKEERFNVLHINMPYKRGRLSSYLGGYLSAHLFNILKKIKPDFVYMIGCEVNNLIFEVELARRLFFPSGKIVGFTMRGLDMPINNLRYKIRWNFTSKIFDAYLCHYPHGMNVLRSQGNFEKPIYLQTQVGVNSDIHYKNSEYRKNIRAKYNIQNEFVFGSASRMDINKGVIDIINALPLNGKWKFIMMGSGKDFNLVKNYVKKRGLEKNIILPGRVPKGTEVTKYMNALDCFVHFPKTTPKWVDTFPLAVVEAMAVGLPIIGSDSGAIPYQLGGDGVIVPEGDDSALKKAMQMIMDDVESAKKMGRKLRERVMCTFEIKHLTKCFNIVMRDIMYNKNIVNHVDQADFYW